MLGPHNTLFSVSGSLACQWWLVAAREAALRVARFLSSSARESRIWPEARASGVTASSTLARAAATSSLSTAPLVPLASGPGERRWPGAEGILERGAQVEEGEARTGAVEERMEAGEGEAEGASVESRTKVPSLLPDWVQSCSTRWLLETRGVEVVAEGGEVELLVTVVTAQAMVRMVSRKCLRGGGAVGRGTQCKVTPHLD